MQKSATPRLRFLPAVLAAFLLVGCNSTEPQQILADIQMVSGDNQTGKVGTVLPQPLVVRAIDVDGDPVRGVPIDWSAPFGNAAISATRTVTDNDGKAGVNVQLGSTPGSAFILAAQADLGAELSFTVQGTP